MTLPSSSQPLAARMLLVYTSIWLKENQQFIVIENTFEIFQFTGDDVGQ
jgi:hypothetical protein